MSPNQKKRLFLKNIKCMPTRISVYKYKYIHITVRPHKAVAVAAAEVSE